jgi:hypothetical protein
MGPNQLGRHAPQAANATIAFSRNAMCAPPRSIARSASTVHKGPHCASTVSCNADRSSRVARRISIPSGGGRSGASTGSGAVMFQVVLAWVYPSAMSVQTAAV